MQYNNHFHEIPDAINQRYDCYISIQLMSISTEIDENLFLCEIILNKIQNSENKILIF